MKKTLQGAVDTRKRATHVLQQGGAWRRTGQQSTRQKAHQQSVEVDPVVAEAADRFPPLRREQPRHRQSGILLGQVVEHADQAACALGFGCVQYLEHELAGSATRRGGARRGGGRAQAKIAVPLSRQWADCDGQPIQIARDALGFRQT
jgi:hypothetical protein